MFNLGTVLVHLVVLSIIKKLDRIHKITMDFFPFSLFLAMQQKGLCLSAVAFEVLGHHRQPALAADLPHGRHHGHHFNHGRVQHGESRLPPGGGFFFLMPVLVEF